MIEKIRYSVPGKFFAAVDSMSKDPKISAKLATTEQIKMAFSMTENMVETAMSEEQLSDLKKPITSADVEAVDFLQILEDFSARIQDKLDLAILKKQVCSVFENSEVLKKFGVSICHGSEKQKRKIRHNEKCFLCCENYKGMCSGIYQLSDYFHDRQLVFHRFCAGNSFPQNGAENH